MQVSDRLSPLQKIRILINDLFIDPGPGTVGEKAGIHISRRKGEIPVRIFFFGFLRLAAGYRPYSVHAWFCHRKHSERHRDTAVDPISDTGDRFDIAFRRQQRIGRFDRTVADFHHFFQSPFTGKKVWIFQVAFTDLIRDRLVQLFIQRCFTVCLQSNSKVKQSSFLSS